MGIILWHLYTGKPLFSGLTFEEAAIALMTRKFAPQLEEDSIPTELRELIEDCLLESKEIRPTFGMVYDRIRLMDISRPRDPLAIAWAGRQAVEYSANAIAQAQAQAQAQAAAKIKSAKKTK